MTEWPKKTLQSILFAYRIHKQASTHFSPFYMMYGREPLLPWQMENDLGPLDMSQEVPQVSIEEAIEKMGNLCQQVLEVADGNIKKAKAHQAKTYNAKHARNDFQVGVKVWKKNPLWNTKCLGGNLCFSWASCGSGDSWASDWSPPSWVFSHCLCSLLFRCASWGVKSPGSGSCKLI